MKTAAFALGTISLLLATTLHAQQPNRFQPYPAPRQTPFQQPMMVPPPPPGPTTIIDLPAINGTQIWTPQGATTCTSGFAGITTCF